ncbi:MAG TPA: DinB family protein [Blastocatellia bacterium]|nr:DinB family protein [Blastocatellia bacterium]
MTETPEQYKKRVLDYVKNQDALKIQAATARKIEKLIKDVPRAKLMRSPAPGRWSVAEIIAHLADAEMVGAFRIRMMLASPGVEIQGYDQNDWATQGKYEKRDPKKSLETFRVVREANLALFKTLDQKQWKKFGVHSERGKEDVAIYAKLYAGHDINHLKQIEAIIGK